MSVEAESDVLRRRQRQPCHGRAYAQSGENLPTTPSVRSLCLIHCLPPAAANLVLEVCAPHAAALVGQLNLVQRVGRHEVRGAGAAARLLQQRQRRPCGTRRRGAGARVLSRHGRKEQPQGTLIPLTLRGRADRRGHLCLHLCARQPFVQTGTARSRRDEAGLVAPRERRRARAGPARALTQDAGARLRERDLRHHLAADLAVCARQGNGARECMGLCAHDGGG